MAENEGSDDNHNEDSNEDKGGSQENLSLDQVHENAVAELENEDDEESDDEESEEDKDSKQEADDTDSKEDEEDDSDEDGAEDDDDDEDEEEEEGDEVPEDQKDKGPEVNTDITQDGEGKIAVKSYDGKMFYFNNVDEVPDDFEPANYKETIRLGKEFARKEERDEKAAADREIAQAKDAQEKRIADIKAEWNRDTEALVKDGKIPADKKEQEKIVSNVYDVINEKLAEGRVIDFKSAFEIFNARQINKTEKKEEKSINQEKKEKGSKISGSGSNAPSSDRKKIIEAPPQGVTLDDVHANVLGSL